MADYLLVRLRTSNFVEWKARFEKRALERKVLGCKGGMIFHDNTDSAKVMILLKWDHAGAQQYVASLELMDDLDQIGVVQQVETYEYLSLIETVAS